MSDACGGGGGAIGSLSEQPSGTASRRASPSAVSERVRFCMTFSPWTRSLAAAVVALGPP
jgi:hypothetical protein